ncbi:MAG: hypothetical protein JW768_01555 [Chitinispirillaceae bacterium]|nr:hypothetical protein [Chitinispirillaceae bacterium]
MKLFTIIIVMIVCMGAYASSPSPIVYNQGYNSSDWVVDVYELNAYNFKLLPGTHWDNPCPSWCGIAGELCWEVYWRDFELNHFRNDYSKLINIRKSSSLEVFASGYLLLGQGDNDPWNNVVVVSDGIDPDNKRTIISVITNDDFNTMLKTSHNSILGQGYDICFVDYHYGAGDIQENARAYLRLLEYACSQANNRAVIAAGFSMGGIISRLALLYGEKWIKNNIKNVTKYISIDSPQQGASVPFDLQYALSSRAVGKRIAIRDPHLGTYVYRWILEYNSNGYLKPNNMQGWIIESAEGLSLTPFMNQYEDLVNVAARQMCYKHIAYKYNTAEHDAFYSFLNSMGDYPKGPRKYSISCGKWANPYPSAEPGVTAADFDFDGYEKIKLYEHELAPGSFYDLFWDTDNNKCNGITIGNNSIGLSCKIPTSPDDPADNHYRPTFMPIYSVFDLRGVSFNDIPPPNSQSDLDRIARKYSPFHKMYLVNTEKRYSHIEFNNELNGAILKALKDKPNIMPVLQLLLD